MTNAGPARPLWLRLLLVPVSWGLVAVGVSMLIRADIGVAPYDVLNTGIAETLDIDIATAFLVDAIVLYLVGWALGGRLGWASVAGTFVISPMIDVLLDRWDEIDALAVRVPLFGVGLLVLCGSVGLAVLTELGPGPTEVFMLGLVARGAPVARARWATDGLVLGIGTLLGGAIGPGTLVFLIAFGPMVARCLRILRYTPPARFVEV
ncbi:MAG: YczE/YyaS/YitT family protein [Desertimonas sp.]